MCFQIVWSLLCLEFKISENKEEILRCEKGLVTSQNMGSLLLFFAYGGLPRGKKFYGFERDLALIQNIYVTFDGRKETAQCKIFLAKRLVYLLLNWRHNSKPQTFFSMDNFPAKRLSFCWRSLFIAEDIPRERNFVCRIAVGFFNSVDSLIDSFLANITSYVCACIFTTYYTRGVW